MRLFQMLCVALFGATAWAGEPMTQASAEKFAREHWFEFELAPVKATFGGDWVKFVAAKQAEEAKFAAQWRASSDDSPRDPRPKTEAQARAQRVVQSEFTQVARARTDELRGLAVKLLEAMKRGELELEPFADDCVMYDVTAKNRRELTLAYFKEHRDEWQKAAALADTSAKDFAADLDFRSPSPPTGMTGQVRIPFGPKAPGARKKPEWYPERWELELWWSGEVMPNANGPLNAAPTSPRPVSRWRFHSLVAPRSRDPSIGLE